ncbi:WYL domain-containing protein [Paenibacillus sp. NPDC058071]|uniref:WYL domain-containing protein n=1 Tax=Paenibacillus sp. NPDC058071 TaxID=3346326 RepID=UPI0036DD5C46
MESYIGQTVQLIYIDRKRKVSIREVKVISVKGPLFKAYCYNAQAFRVFNAANVVDIEPVRKRVQA